MIFSAPTGLDSDAEFARPLANVPVFNVINAKDIVTGYWVAKSTEQV
jgi:hypothetical protein